MRTKVCQVRVVCLNQPDSRRLDGVTEISPSRDRIMTCDHTSDYQLLLPRSSLSGFESGLGRANAQHIDYLPRYESSRISRVWSAILLHKLSRNRSRICALLGVLVITWLQRRETIMDAVVS